jgi:hypothetical protein
MVNMFIMRIFLSILFVFLANISFSSPSETLIDALVHVESKGNVHARGDNGRAIGILQIHKEVIDDVNKAYGVAYKYVDRKNPIISREICRKYLVLHGGFGATNETYARIWNGGPNGHRRKSTRGYWIRVKCHLLRG